MSFVMDSVCEELYSHKYLIDQLKGEEHDQAVELYDLVDNAISHNYSSQKIAYWLNHSPEVVRYRELIELLKRGSEKASEFAHEVNWCVVSGPRFFNES